MDLLKLLSAHAVNRVELLERITAVVVGMPDVMASAWYFRNNLSASGSTLVQSRRIWTILSIFVDGDWILVLGTRWCLGCSGAPVVAMILSMSP